MSLNLIYIKLTCALFSCVHVSREGWAFFDTSALLILTHGCFQNTNGPLNVYAKSNLFSNITSAQHCALFCSHHRRLLSFPKDHGCAATIITLSLHIYIKALNFLIMFFNHVVRQTVLRSIFPFFFYYSDSLYIDIDREQASTHLIDSSSHFSLSASSDIH